MTASAEPGVEPHGPYYDLVVAEVIDETHDSRSVVFDIPAALSETFAYQAGQFLTFRVEVDGKRLVRCYSLASSPATETRHKVTIKRVVDGRASNWFNDHVSAGTTLEVMKPAGVFVLQDRTTPVVLFAGGSGITPVISIVKTALATTGRPVKLVYANRDERSIIFKAELDALQAKHSDRLEIVHRLDDRDGFADDDFVRAQVGVQTGADFYVCGPGPFMDIVESTLEHMGVAHDQFHIERFESPDEFEPEAEVEIGMPVTGGGPVVSVKLDGSEHEVALQEGETILHGARRLGLEPPFACEDGYCGCCMAMVKEGDVEMLHNDGGVDANQIAQGWVLTCQGVPKTPKVRVEYPE
ncbi:MAG: ferredoxin--NADP reductase [Actinomycetota bacterium]|nr:ferredoxin--NADP reductase [Actinomycetota bacterium]